MPNKNRDRGHNFEREMAKFFREMGYECTTSRYSSRETDDKKIDLCGTGPFNVQCKFSDRLGPLHGVIKEMPDEEGKYRIVAHKRNREGVLVAMELDTFRELVEMLKANKIL